jgi:hypothetical protein
MVAAGMKDRRAVEPLSSCLPFSLPGLTGVALCVLFAWIRTIARDFDGYRAIERQVLVSRNGPKLFEIHLQNAAETLKTQFDSTGVLVMSRRPMSEPNTGAHF